MIVMDPTNNLIKVIEMTLAELTLDKLNLFLLSNSNICRALNEKTVKHLLKILQRDGKIEDKELHVNCTLSCLQHFLKTNVDSKKWEQVAENISKLGEGMYVVSDCYVKKDSLTVEVVNTISDLAEHSGSVADHMLNYMAQCLLETASSTSCSHLTRPQVLGLVSTLLLKSSRQARTQTLSSPAILDYLVKLSTCLLVCGDYETQVGVVEVLARSSTFIKGTKQASQLFTGHPSILQAFNNYKFINFDPECRVFLNEVNQSLGDKRLVFSVPCMIVTADNIRLKKPIDLLYKEFWADWNLGSRTLSLFHMVSECWEFVAVAEDNVEHATARNSSCKERYGNVIAAIKMEITMKTGVENSQLPKVLKIYFHKTQAFADIEETVIRKILGNKYKSDVTYSDVPQLRCPVTPTPDPKPNETWTCHSEIDKTIPDQEAAENESESPDVVGPSPAAPGHASTLRHIRDLCQLGKKESSETQHMKGQKKLEHCKDKAGMYRTPPGERVLNVNHKLVSVEQIPHKIKNTKMEQKRNLEILNVALNSNTSQSTTSAKLSKNMNKSFIASRTSQFLDEENYGSPKTMFPVEVSNRSGLEVSLVGLNSKETKQNDELDLHNNRRALKKRRLYSSENNSIKDLVLSSQEDFSVEIPDYKFKKQDKKVAPVRNMDRKNISYSYISSKEKTEKPNDVILDTEHIFKPNQQALNSKKPVYYLESFKSSAPTFKYYKNPDKKLLDLNKTSVSSKISNIFPSNSEYSFPSSDRGCCQRTYSRPKQKKRVRVVQWADSDSDPEYVPPVKVPAQCEARQTARRGRSRTYVKQLPQREDPVLDSKPPLEMQLEPLHLDQPEMIPRDIELPSALPNSSKARKNNPVTVCKKSTNKEEKKIPTKRNTRSRKNTKPLEEANEAHVIMDVVNYEPTTANGDDKALEMLSHSFAQDNATENEIFEITHFAEYCVKDVKRMNDNIHNLAMQQREMSFAAYNMKAEALVTAMTSQQRSMEAVGNSLRNIKSVVDLAYDMHTDISTQLQSHVTQFQEARQELKEKNAEIKKSLISKTRSLAQGLSRHISNLFSFFRGGSNKKALPEQTGQQ